VTATSLLTAVTVGLVLGILQGSFEAFLPYGLAALALMAMTPPRIKARVIEAIPLLPA
jgi:F0F1-type ATP synthase assembly protein I